VIRIELQVVARAELAAALLVVVAEHERLESPPDEHAAAELSTSACSGAGSTPDLIATRADRRAAPGLHVDEQGFVTFAPTGWFEVLLTVEWGSANRVGRRFSHTSIPDRHPLHSEAIEADVLIDISGGKQLLRGNALFGPKGVDRIQLEVWRDSGAPVNVDTASLEIRPLPNA
jgi:hypothetical protein